MILPHHGIAPRDQHTGKLRDALQQEDHKLSVLPRDVQLFLMAPVEGLKPETGFIQIEAILLL